jgi:hypothetical protein
MPIANLHEESGMGTIKLYVDGSVRTLYTKSQLRHKV